MMPTNTLGALGGQANPPPGYVRSRSGGWVLRGDPDAMPDDGPMGLGAGGAAPPEIGPANPPPSYYDPRGLGSGGPNPPPTYLSPQQGSGGVGDVNPPSFFDPRGPSFSGPPMGLGAGGAAPPVGVGGGGAPMGLGAGGAAPPVDMGGGGGSGLLGSGAGGAAPPTFPGASADDTTAPPPTDAGAMTPLQRRRAAWMSTARRPMNTLGSMRPMMRGFRPPAA